MESMLCVFSFPLAAFSHQPSADVYSSSPLSHISHRQMSIPPRRFLTSAIGRCLFPLAIYGEGVADRPGGRSGVIGRGYKYRSQRIYIYKKSGSNEPLYTYASSEIAMILASQFVYDCYLQLT